MDHEKCENDKIDDIILPGFRFHPTDEELVGFYLKRKIQHRALPIELIKQVDIYKYDPWDLPKLASTGEKEWYFYCPRDRKYRNSARPNRVTGAGFWKATGTDRPIYSSDGTKCIGLKKSLVFYRGRAAKGLKTDWMMHEFRLPSSNDSSSPKKILDKTIPPNDSWAICRIFKKTSSMAQRALSQAWISHLPDTTPSDVFSHCAYSTHFSPETMQLFNNNDIQHVSTDNFSSLNIPSYRPVINPVIDLPNNFIFSPIENSGPTTNIIEIEEPGHQINSFAISLAQDFQDDEDMKRDLNAVHGNNQWRNIQGIGFPISLSSDLPWDPAYTSDMSTTYSTN